MEVKIGLDGSIEINGEEESVINASIIAFDPPNVAPLVNLLRSERPIPAGVRHMLAEMFDPSTTGYFFHRAKIKCEETKAHSNDRDTENLKLANFYETLTRSGMSAQAAALETGEKFGISDREVFRRRKDALKFAAWLKGGKRE